MAAEDYSDCVFRVGHWREDFWVCPVRYEPLSLTKGPFKSRSPVATGEVRRQGTPVLRHWLRAHLPGTGRRAGCDQNGPRMTSQLEAEAQRGKATSLGSCVDATPTEPPATCIVTCQLPGSLCRPRTRSRLRWIYSLQLNEGLCELSGDTEQPVKLMRSRLEGAQAW